MWNAFAGYRDVYGKLPTDREVQRVRLWFIAINERDYEEYQKQQKKLEELEQKNAGAGAEQQTGRRISVGQRGM